MQYYIYKTKQEMGAAAADKAIEIVKWTLGYKGNADIVHATGASQFDVLAELVPRYRHETDVSKLWFAHMDEYIHLPGGVEHRASFRKYLQERIADPLGLEPSQFLYVNGDAKDPKKECGRLNSIIGARDIDLIVMGFGENGHVAFNDPPADFATTDPYIVVNLDEKCRRQQLGEGWFPSLDAVPKQAISMSVYQIMACRNIVCVVPDERKAEAVVNCIEGAISRMVPGSRLQEHPNAHIFLDAKAAMYLSRGEYGKPIEVRPNH